MIKNQINIKIDSEVKSFSAGTVLMYQEVDKLLSISKIIKNYNLKEKGVPLEDCIKFLVCGVLDQKRSVREIHNNKDTLGKYIGEELSKTVLKTLYRALKTIGPKGEKIYSELNSKFEKICEVVILQNNIDYSSTYFEGEKVTIAKHGY